MQPDQAALQGFGQYLGDLGLAHARLAFKEQGPAELEGEEQGRCQAAIGDVVAGTQQRQGVVDRCGNAVFHSKSFVLSRSRLRPDG